MTVLFICVCLSAEESGETGYPPHDYGYDYDCI